METREREILQIDLGPYVNLYDFAQEKETHTQKCTTSTKLCFVEVVQVTRTCDNTYLSF